MVFGRMRRPVHPVVTVLGQIRDTVTHILRDIHQLKEYLMAQFDGLNGDLAELKTTVAELAERVDRRLDEVLDDSVDQAATDAAAADIREVTAALKNIARDEEPTPAEPTNPADNPNEPSA